MGESFSWKNVAVVVAVIVPLVTLYLPTMFRSESNESRIDEIEQTRYTRCIENNKGKEATNRLVEVVSESLQAAIDRGTQENTPESVAETRVFQEQLDKLDQAPLLDCGQAPSPK